MRTLCDAASAVPLSRGKLFTKVKMHALQTESHAGHAPQLDMDDREENIRLSLLLCLYLRRRRRRRVVCSQRSVWIRSIFEKRQLQGDYHKLLQEMRLRDTKSHFQFLRMSKERFNMLVAKVC